DLRHEAFLAEGTGDPRRAFAKSLLPSLGSEGTIFVYNAAFERTRLKELQEFCPDRADELGSVIRRLYDLLPLTRDCYYHRDQHGSWSIKDVLGTIDADLAYDGLTVKDGGMAQEAFVELLGSDVLADRRQELRAALLAYCGRDTMALVRLARHLRGEPELLLPI